MNIKIQYKDTYAVINTKGAELKEVNSSGVDYFWNSDPKYWGRSAPLLFPIIGTCKDKKAIIDGVTYDMPKHGIVRDLEFNVVSQEDNMVELSVSFNEETLKYYPFKFKLVVTYTLDEKMTMEQTVKPVYTRIVARRDVMDKIRILRQELEDMETIIKEEYLTEESNDNSINLLKLRLNEIEEQIVRIVEKR